MTRAAIADDDQDLLRSRLRRALEAGGIDVVDEASNGREALEEISRARPDAVLMDIRMPVPHGMAATPVAAQGAAARGLVLTTYDLDRCVHRALKAVASGLFLLQATPQERLVAAVERVAAGESLLAPSLIRRPIEEPSATTTHPWRFPPCAHSPVANWGTMRSRWYGRSEAAALRVVTE